MSIHNFAMSNVAGASAQGGSFYPYLIDNSVRMSDASNSTLQWTAGTPSSSTTWTMSFWIKRWNQSTNQGVNEFFSAGTSGSAYSFFSFVNHYITHQTELPGARNKNWTNQLWRDSSSWYHFVFRANLNEGTQANRLRMYVNGVEYTATADGITQSTWAFINASGVSQNWGGKTGIANGNPGCDHYLADINFCDGQSYAPTEFGETKSGVWVPIDPSVTYGNNGYRLEFKQTGTGADANGIGADTSGNDNHFTVAGVTAHDVMTGESPTNNWCTFNPLDQNDASGLTYPTVYSEGNLKLSQATGFINRKATFSLTSGKWYWEIKINDSTPDSYFGVSKITGDARGALDNDEATIRLTNGDLYTNAATSSYGTAFSNGDVCILAVDMDAGKFWAGRNGTWFASGDPAAGTNEGKSGLASELFPSVSLADAENCDVNFGQNGTFNGTKTAGGNSDGNGYGDFLYTVPSGFLALCSANLPEPTISPNAAEQADDYFSTVLYTGDGTSGQAITGVGHSPDFVWIKKRSATGNHQLFDTIRGATYRLNSNTTNAEASFANVLQSFDSDGFTVGGDGDTGGSGQTYVGWNWKAGGTAVSNTDGSITSSVSAAPDAGFSIVSWVSDGSVTPASFGHGLNSKPELIIIKSRDSAANWVVQSSTFSNQTNDFILLNTTGAVQTAGTAMWGTINDSIITFRHSANSSNGDDMIAYCFHSVDGFSKVGSYVGNGNADGSFVYTGFRPAWIMWKSSTQASSGWYIVDTQRNPYNEAKGADLYAQDTAAEPASGSGNMIDINSNGFKHRSSRLYINGSGATYIYLAFAESPFKYSNAR